MRFEAVRILIGAHGAGLSWLWSMPRGGKAAQFFRFGRGKGETGEFLRVVDTDQYNWGILEIHAWNGKELAENYKHLQETILTRTQMN